jgi:hypothetical protein
MPSKLKEDVKKTSTGNAIRSKNASNLFIAVLPRLSNRLHSVARNTDKTEVWICVVRLAPKRQSECERSRNASASMMRGGDRKPCFKESGKKTTDGDKRICTDERRWAEILASLRRQGGKVSMGRG